MNSIALMTVASANRTQWLPGLLRAWPAALSSQLNCQRSSSRAVTKLPFGARNSPDHGSTSGQPSAPAPSMVFATKLASASMVSKCMPISFSRAFQFARELLLAGLKVPARR